MESNICILLFLVYCINNSVTAIPTITNSDTPKEKAHGKYMAPSKNLLEVNFHKIIKSSLLRAVVVQWYNDNVTLVNILYTKFK